MFITTAQLTVTSVRMSLDIANMLEVIKAELDWHQLKEKKLVQFADSLDKGDTNRADCLLDCLVPSNFD